MEHPVDMSLEYLNWYLLNDNKIIHYKETSHAKCAEDCFRDTGCQVEYTIYARFIHQSIRQAVSSACTYLSSSVITAFQSKPKYNIYTGLGLGLVVCRSGRSLLQEEFFACYQILQFSGHEVSLNGNIVNAFWFKAILPSQNEKHGNKEWEIESSLTFFPFWIYLPLKLILLFSTWGENLKKKTRK